MKKIKSFLYAFVGLSLLSMCFDPSIVYGAKEPVEMVHQTTEPLVEEENTVAPLSNNYLYDDGPTVHLDTIKVEPKEVNVNEKVKVSMEITSETPIEGAEVTFKSSMNINEKVILKYNPQTDLFEGSLTIKDYFNQGEWHLYSIRTYSYKGSGIRYTQIYADFIVDDMLRTEDFSAHSFNVNGSHAPILLTETIQSSGKFAYGDPLDTTFQFKNAKNIASKVRVGFKGPDKENSRYPNLMYFDFLVDSQGMARYVDNFNSHFKESMEQGKWEMYSLTWTLKNEYGEGMFGYTQTIYDKEHNINEYPHGTADLSAGDFILQEKVSDEPLVDLSTLKLNKSEFIVGDTIEIEIEPIKNGNDLTSLSFSYRNLRTDEIMSYGIEGFQEKQDVYRIQINTDRNTSSGEWVLDNIQQRDNEGNYTEFYNSTLYDGNNYDLSKGNFTLHESTDPAIIYSTHVQSIGWQSPVENGAMSGTAGQAKRLEGIVLKLDNIPFEGSVQYRTHVQSHGWMDWVDEGNMSGTEGQAKRLEAIQIRLTGEMAQEYDIYYRVHAEKYGWLDWAKNGQEAGTAGLKKRLEAIEVKLVPKGSAAPGITKIPYIEGLPTVIYSTHVQSIGWQPSVKNGALSGTAGKAKRLESIKINIEDTSYDGEIQYVTHIQSSGWQNWVSNGNKSGTEGRAKRLEAIRIRLTGEIAKYYDIYYRVHAESYGWLGWTKNGQQAGTEGKAKRLEAIEIVVVEKGTKAPGKTKNSFIN